MWLQIIIKLLIHELNVVTIKPTKTGQTKNIAENHKTLKRGENEQKVKSELV